VHGVKGEFDPTFVVMLTSENVRPESVDLNVGAKAGLEEGVPQTQSLLRSGETTSKP